MCITYHCCELARSMRLKNKPNFFTSIQSGQIKVQVLQRLFAFYPCTCSRLKHSFLGLSYMFTVHVASAFTQAGKLLPITMKGLSLQNSFLHQKDSKVIWENLLHFFDQESLKSTTTNLTDKNIIQANKLKTIKANVCLLCLHNPYFCKCSISQVTHCSRY